MHEPSGIISLNSYDHHELARRYEVSDVTIYKSPANRTRHGG